jgi:clan AA aspartic protease
MHRAARRAQLRAEETAVHTPGLKGSVHSGTAHVAVTIRNPAAPGRSWEALFLVDPTATDSLVPRPRLEAIGLRPKNRRAYELPDGRKTTVAITTADIEFMGETVGGTILFGDADAEPVLGATALASAGIEADPTAKTLKRLPAMRLKTHEESDASLPDPAERSRTEVDTSAGPLEAPPAGVEPNGRR